MATPTSPTPSSPGLEGYDSALEETSTPRRPLRAASGGSNAASGENAARGGSDADSDSDDSNLTIVSPPKHVSLLGLNPGPARSRTGSLPPRNSRGQFTRGRGRSVDSAASDDSLRTRHSSGVGREIGSSTDLQAASLLSLAWDNYSPADERSVFDFEEASTTGLASDTLRGKDLQEILEGIERLPAVDERGESRLSQEIEPAQVMSEEDAAAAAALGEATVMRALAQIEDCAAEIEDDFLPYVGKRLVWDRLQEMMGRTKQMKKVVRGNDLLLKRSRNAGYDEEKQEMVRLARQNLTAVMMHFDEVLIELTAERAAAGEDRAAAVEGVLNHSMSSTTSEVDTELLEQTLAPC